MLVVDGAEIEVEADLSTELSRRLPSWGGVVRCENPHALFDAFNARDLVMIRLPDGSEGAVVLLGCGEVSEVQGSGLPPYDS